MAELFHRDMKVTAGTLQISAQDREGFDQPLLKMRLEVEAAVTSGPNKCTLKIWNLSKDSRTRVQTSGDPLLIEAGYVGLTRVVFSGDIQFSSTNREGPNWITTISAGDGGSKYKNARINENLGPGSDMGAVLKKAAEALGVDLGNLAAKVTKGSVRTALTEWTNGGVLSGKAAEILTEVCQSMGFQWGIQRGALLFLEKDETTEDEAIVLGPATGLVDSPEIGEDGKVMARSLLNGDIFPGRRLQFDSREIQGLYRVDKTKIVADTWGTDWNTKIEAHSIG